MEKNNEDLKQGEEETPEGTDHPEEETPESKEEGQEEETPKESSEEEEVKISKSELEQLRKDANEKENYRKGIIRLNRLKGRALPGSEPEKRTDDNDDEYNEPEREYVTKKEMLERDNKAVIDKACEDPEIDENWDEIIAFYIPPRDNTQEAKIAAVRKARNFWSIDKKANEIPKTENKGKKATKELASDKGLSKGHEKKPTIPKKSIMPKRTSMTEWYGKQTE